MKRSIVPIIIIIVICVFLLVNIGEYSEGFISAISNTGSQCGINRDSCPAGKRCVNGYCGSTKQPKLPYYTGLPVWP